MNLIQDFEKTFLRKNYPAFRIGDTLSVHLRITVTEESGDGEENGNSKKKKVGKKEAKERIQVFTGTVISKAGSGLSETFTLYRNAYGSFMEKVFLLHSPKIVKIEVVRSGKVRRAKLTYIRGRAGKAAKIREKMDLFQQGSAQPAAAPQEKGAVSSSAGAVQRENSKNSENNQAALENSKKKQNPEEGKA